MKTISIDLIYSASTIPYLRERKDTCEDIVREVGEELEGVHHRADEIVVLLDLGQDLKGVKTVVETDVGMERVNTFMLNNATSRVHHRTDEIVVLLDLGQDLK